MKLRRSFTFAMALIGALFAVSAGGSDAKGGVQPGHPQLSFLESLPSSPVSSPVIAWADPASPLDLGATPGEERAQKASAKCTKDADCKLHDYYCEGCNCLSLLVGVKPPKCTGQTVQCLVAPCLNKHAACVDGGCVVAGGAASK
jgi:hypothetical protein